MTWGNGVLAFQNRHSRYPSRRAVAAAAVRPTPGPGVAGGGGGRGGDDNLPSYRERLRRYRMLIAFCLTSVVMIFVSFTTAYVVRKAGAVWDPARNEYVSEWVPTNLPVGILLVNTFILLISSLTLEVARRRAAEDVALAPIANIPGIRVSENRSLPWVWATIVLGLAFLVRPVSRLASASAQPHQHRNQRQQFVLLHPHRSSRRPPDGRNPRAAVCRDRPIGCCGRRRRAASSSTSLRGIGTSWECCGFTSSRCCTSRANFPCIPGKPFR